MQTVVETPAYLADAKFVGLDESDRSGVVDYLARNPSAGDLIVGSGGARKVRIARRGGGRSGGFRVLTAYLGADIPVILLGFFAKNEKANLSKVELKLMTEDLEAIKKAVRKKRSIQ
jgi:hypothetical protein